MANSSDWLGALADAGAAPPGWLTLLGETSEFRETAPGIVAPAAPDAPQVMPQPAPEPFADPSADALAQAYARGEAAGRAAALAEAEQHADRQRALRLAFRKLDEAASEVLAADLADTVIALCDGVLAAHAADRAALLVRCREAARRIGGAAAGLRLHLHPADIESLGPAALEGWAVIADSTIEPGGLLLEGADGAVRDGPADWRRAIAAAVRG
ncbi:FliH/SctL family protein [Erythrobacter tepidarius]|uniref:FliH/SctL family protein n=1 Tax=Erythrobacter tepidarius TaxID=60454 RepID=UPI000A3797C5|nr:FliH/SctL family protein [Erythrobacter tepidarius]